MRARRSGSGLFLLCFLLLLDRVSALDCFWDFEGASGTYIGSTSPIPGLPDGAIWMVGKMAFFFFMFAMVKAIVPRYRYDQLMRIGWKVFLPMSLGWVVFVAFAAQFEWFGGAYVRWAVGG